MVVQNIHRLQPLEGHISLLQLKEAGMCLLMLLQYTARESRWHGKFSFITAFTIFLKDSFMRIFIMS